MSPTHGGSKTIAVAIVFCIAALALVLHSTDGRTELLDKLAQSTQELDSETTDATSSVKGQVGAENLARGILSSARKQFQAKKKEAVAAAKAAKQKQIALKKIAAKHASHRKTHLDGFTLDAKAQAQLSGKKASASPPTSSLLKRMPAYLDKKHKQSRAAKLESQIANHKLTTRGLIAAVQKAEQHQMHELNDGLKDQTDDLIIAKINQLKQGKAADTQNYVLSNALNKQERSELASGQGKLHPPKAAAPPQAQQAPQQAQAQYQAPAQQAAWGGPGGGAAPPLQRQNQAIVHATAGSKGGNPEGMLSSYDRELLSKGPAGLEDDDAKAPTNMLSQVPAQQYQYRSPTPPQYQQAYQYPQQQYPQYQQPQYAEPQYQQQPQYQQMYQQAPQYEPPAPYQQAYQQYPQQEYQPPAPYQQAYQYPQQYQQEPAPYQQAYQYPQPQYQQPAPYQQMYQQPAPEPAAPTPPAPAVRAAVPSASQYGESAAVASHQYNGGSGGGTLWKMFSAGIGGGAPPGGGGGGGGMGGLSQSGSGLSMGGGGGGDGSLSSLSSSLSDASESDGGDGGGGGGGGGSLGAVGDPKALLPKGVGTKPTANLAPAAKSAVAAQMQALRESIMDDFSSTTKMGKEAGYLPPPP